MKTLNKNFKIVTVTAISLLTIALCLIFTLQSAEANNNSYGGVSEERFIPSVELPSCEMNDIETIVTYVDMDIKYKGVAFNSFKINQNWTSDYAKGTNWDPNIGEFVAANYYAVTDPDIRLSQLENCKFDVSALMARYNIPPNTPVKIFVEYEDGTYGALQGVWENGKCSFKTDKMWKKMSVVLKEWPSPVPPDPTPTPDVGTTSPPTGLVFSLDK